MELLFYFFGLVAIISTMSVVFNVYPVYALLSLIVYCLSLSCIFFILGSYLAGVLEVIIYAGAIMVLFIFVVMMLNIDSYSVLSSDSLVFQFNLKQLFLIFTFFVIILYVIWSKSNNFYISNVYKETITLKNIGISLFGDYVFIVELASILLLGALIISLRIAKGFR